MSWVGGVVDHEVGSERGKMEGYGPPNPPDAAADDGDCVYDSAGDVVSHAAV